MRATAKAVDAYAFGVVLLELLSGKPPLLRGESTQSLALHFAETLERLEEMAEGGTLDGAEVGLVTLKACC